MKKTNLLLALLSSTLILASCGGDGTESKGNENDTSKAGDSNATPSDATDSTPDTSVDTRSNTDKAKELFAEMALGKSSTITYAGNEEIQYYGDNKGIMTFDLTGQATYNQGVAVVANYGIYSAIMMEESGTEDYFLYEILTPNTALTIDDLYLTTKDLGAAAKSAEWKESSRTHTISTEDATFTNTLLTILGYDGYVNGYSEKKTSFVVNEEGSSLTNMAIELNGSSDTSKYKNNNKIEGLKISDVGKTVNLDFEVIITNPSIAPRSAWTKEESDIFGELYTNFTIPFPGTGSYAINTGLTQNGGFMYEDLGCGNIVNAYKTKLETAGFTVDDETTNAANGIYGYAKTLVPATATVGPLMAYVQFTWMNSNATATVYPNGRFILLLTVVQEELTITLDALMTTLGGYTLDTNGNAWWPSMTIQGCTKATFSDVTSSYQGYDLATTSKLYFATEAEAIAAVQTINGQLSKNGYTSAYLSYYGCMTLEVTEDYYEYETVDIYAKVAYDDQGNYLGYITLIIRKYVEYDDYDDYDW